MKIIQLVYVLFKINLLRPSFIIHLIKSLFHSGINLMTLLEAAAKQYPEQIAIIDDNESILYKDLWIESQELVHHFYNTYELHSEEKVAVLCRNHIPLIQSIFALSRLGADIFLLNTEMGTKQLNDLLITSEFHAVLYDLEFSSSLKQFKGKRY